MRANAFRPTRLLLSKTTRKIQRSDAAHRLPRRARCSRARACSGAPAPNHSIVTWSFQVRFGRRKAQTIRTVRGSPEYSPLSKSPTPSHPLSNTERRILNENRGRTLRSTFQFSASACASIDLRFVISSQLGRFQSDSDDRWLQRLAQCVALQDTFRSSSRDTVSPTLLTPTRIGRARFAFRKGDSYRNILSRECPRSL